MTTRSRPSSRAARGDIAVLALALLASALNTCRSESSAPHGKTSTATSPAPARSTSPVASRTPEPSAAATLSASSVAAAPPPVQGWLVGDWRGSASVYGDVVEDHQTYDRRDVQLTLVAEGHFELAMQVGNTPGGTLERVERHCQASGRLAQSGSAVTLRVDSSTCRAAPGGSRAEAQLVRVNECLVQWNTRSGTMPYEVRQLALRRRDCR